MTCKHAFHPLSETVIYCRRCGTFRHAIDWTEAPSVTWTWNPLPQSSIGSLYTNSWTVKPVAEQKET